MSDLSNHIFQDEAKAREYLESVRWPDGPVCAFCGQFDTVKPVGGKSMGPGWYHCKDCRRKFTVRVGTLYERSHVPLHKWLLATHLLCASKKGISAHQLHRMLGVTYKTAWFMAHRIREGMQDPNPGPMGGRGKIVEVDETYQGSSGYNLKPEGWELKRGLGDKYKVITLVERGGRARSMKVDNMNSRTVREFLVTNADRKSVLSTDESVLYKGVGKEFARHFTVNHSKGQYAKGYASTNTVEGFFSIFKRGMRGIYQHCGEKHLQRYLYEFDFRYSHRKISDFERADIALKGIEGKRLTYRRPSSWY